ncbi:expressed unknown protein [Seminavis robusta]|uniref:Nudix hydrolase domain-containing protein n=1 Tax=Seminavis robusta TaxID=568900 RepID=A0A9N8H167_9STRA|nr:expressed unknown protein [Seminavis robusta]|eukprot:Sro12_g009060.1 n/a (439) ;mRNA; f:10155-11471
MIVASSVAVSVKRVVTCFILSSSSPSTRENLRIAVFRRKDTMPTFASHWAGISGSMEQGEEPWQTALRELQEETNLVPNKETENKQGPSCIFVPTGGLYVDVPFKENRKIRVYPFVVHLPRPAAMEMRGTEHDYIQFVSVEELEQLEPAVPGLATAFHHATAGAFLRHDALPEPVWQWSKDRVNGAAFLARKALELAKQYPSSASTMTMLRPSMVPIVNVLKAFEQQQPADDSVAESILVSLKEEGDRSIQLGVDCLTTLYQQQSKQNCAANDDSSSFTIGTFSRSSTILKLLQRFLEKREARETINIQILCGKSIPGGEGELMAQDLSQAVAAAPSAVSVECIEDQDMQQRIRDGKVNVVIVGADCVMEDQFVNKVGTKALAETCQESGTAILCCTDQWKFWSDQFPPPLEDIFECIPRPLLTHLAMHRSQESTSDS